MADRKITIKRNNSGTVESLFPTTTADQIVIYDSDVAGLGGDGLINVFDSNNVLKSRHLPSAVFGGLKFKNAIDALNTSTVKTLDSVLTTLYSNTTWEQNIDPGDFWIITTAGKISGENAGGSGGHEFFVLKGEEGQNTETASIEDESGSIIDLEVGDYIVYTGKEVVNVSGDISYKYFFFVVNNDERIATSTRPGLISHTSQSKLDGIASNADNYGGFTVKKSGQTGTSIGSGDDLIFAQGGATTISESSGTVTISSTDTVYTHPTHSGSSSAGTETTLSDITLVDSLNLTNGHINSFTHRKLVAGSNVTIEAQADGDIEISSTDTNTVYTHPSYTTRSINTSGVDVLDTFTSNSIGSVTGITTRTLPDATTSASGVMSSTDKTKLDATNVVQYAAAATSSATYGFIFFDED
jgi:hypothetical protein